MTVNGRVVPVAIAIVLGVIIGLSVTFISYAAPPYPYNPGTVYSDPAYQVVAVALEDVLGFKLKQSEMRLERVYDPNTRSMVPIVYVETTRNTYGVGTTSGTVIIRYSGNDRRSGTLEIDMSIYDYSIGGHWALVHTSTFSGLGVLGEPWIGNRPTKLNLILRLVEDILSPWW